MRKLFIIPILLIGFAISGVCQSPSDDSKKLGLVAYLTYVKSMSELQMSRLANNQLYLTEKQKAQSFNSNYNLLKLATDKLINQMCADMQAKNGLGTYNSVNKYLKDPTYRAHTELDPYKSAINEIDGLLEGFLIKTYSSALSGASIEEITGIVALGHSLITDARDFRQKKVESITGTLKELKLTSLVDLLKLPEKD
jgi:hypothetical protein